MQNAITTLRIQNFKSIKDVTMQPRRVNIIIGEPNVGKSNILEALSLLGGMQYNNSIRFMDDMIRFRQAKQIFYDNFTAIPISVETDKFVSYVSRDFRDFVANRFIYQYMAKDFQAKFMDFEDFYVVSESENDIHLEGALQRFNEKIFEEGINKQGLIQYMAGVFDASGTFLNSSDKAEKGALSIFISGFITSVRTYLFQKAIDVCQERNFSYLLPPHGDNLKEILQSRPVLRAEVAPLFRYYGQKLLLRMGSNELEVAKEVGELMYTYPYSSIADTLQRLIFYLAAIESNDDAVLLFEEPEAHSYPVYVSRLARRIVESRNNQFFVVTHSPYFITEVLEEMLTNDELKSELAIFVTYYEDYQTKVRQLGDEEVYNIRRDGLDVFYNMARFVPES